MALTLTTSQFEPSGRIPSKYTCDGEDVNPPLEIKEVPNGTTSLVLIMDDPDSPSGNFDHWLVWNISPDTTEIGENSVPNGSVEGTTDFNRTGYGGPCPHSGEHHYQFKLFALDTTLELDPSTRKPELEKAMHGHVLEETMLVGLYNRNN